MKTQQLIPDFNVICTTSGTGVLTISSVLKAQLTICPHRTNYCKRRIASGPSNAENGLNNTVIGNETPEEATFTQATGTATPTVGTHLANKSYVDSTATALSIALGV